MTTITDVIGYSAASVGTCLMLPQVFHTLRTKQMQGVSSGMLWAYVINCTLWDSYGLMLAAVPLIVCNTAALGIGTFQLYLKRKYR